MSHPGKPHIALGPILGLLLLIATVSSPTAATIGQLTDPEHPSVEAGLDIVAAAIDQDRGQLTFSIQTRGDIPTSLSGPEDVITFLWLVDTDHNAGTGQPHGDLGSEFNVRAVIGTLYGGGFVDVTGGVPGGGSGSVEVAGNQIRITIYLPQIGNPADFDWKCSTFHIASGSWVSGNPETAKAPAVPSPYTPVARVAVTTPLLALCPFGPASGAVEVELRDAAGNVMPPEEHFLTYHSTYEPVATVDEAGVVTAHALPAEHWQTPYIEVWADGVMAGNSAVVRVNATDLGLSWQMYPAEHISLYLVPQLEGVDLDALTSDYEVVEAVERAWQDQTVCLGTTPFSGGHQFLVLDVASDPVTSVCGASGNPIRLGWTWGVPIHNSCYIVNDPANRVPQWFVMFHEVGHNFNGASIAFNVFCSGPSGPHNTAFSEGLASLAALWSWQAVLADPGGLGSFARDDIDRQFTNSAAYFAQELADYRAAGPDYDTLDPNAVDGILMEMRASYGIRTWFDLMSTFLPPDESMPVSIDTREKQATWFVAAMSASTGQDLRSLFQSRYGFPVDDAVWPEILFEVQTRIAMRTAPVAVDGGRAPVDVDRLLGTGANPARAATDIRFVLARSGGVTLCVHDALGRVVATPFAGRLPAGSHVRSWDLRDATGRAVPSGIYFVRLATKRGMQAKRLAVIR